MANFEANQATTATATTHPAPYSEPPDPGGTSNLDSTQNQLHRSLAKVKKALWNIAWLFSPNPADVARKIKERDRRTTQENNDPMTRRTA